jgi:hypothetical protein
MLRKFKVKHKKPKKKKEVSDFRNFLVVFSLLLFSIVFSFFVDDWLRKTSFGKFFGRNLHRLSFLISVLLFSLLYSLIYIVFCLINMFVKRFKKQISKK